MNTKDIKELVNREDWQQIRKNLLGTWLKTPTANVNKLRDWLGPTKDASTDKLRIILNYLTSSAFRLRIVQHKEITSLLNSVRNELERRNV